MAKRLQCLDIWDKDWYIDLEDHYKLFFQYIEDNCSEAGIWAPQKARFERLLSQKKQIDFYKFLDQVNKDETRIILLDNGKWLLVSYFADRQGNEIHVTNGFHRRVIKDLIINGATELIQGVLNVQEAIENYNEFNQERKKRAKQKLKNSISGTHFSDDHTDTFHPAEGEYYSPPLSPGEAPGPIEEKKIQIPGGTEKFLLPEIRYISDGTQQSIEIEKFLMTARFDIFCRIENIIDADLFKKLIESFLQTVIKKSSSKKKAQTSTQLEEYFNNWYNKVKNNTAFMQELMQKAPPPQKILRPRQVDS